MKQRPSVATQLQLICIGVHKKNIFIDSDVGKARDDIVAKKDSTSPSQLSFEPKKKEKKNFQPDDD